MLHFLPFPPYSTPPRDATLDVSLENDDEDEDKVVMDDLEHEEKVGGEEANREEAEFNALSNLADSLPDGSSEEEDLAMETDPRHRISQSLMKALLNRHAVEEEATVEEKGNVCFCDFLPSDEEYYDSLDEATRDQAGDLNDQRYWNSDNEEDPEVVTEVGAVNEESEALVGLLGGLNEGSLKHSLNLDGHVEFYSEEEGEKAADTLQ